MKLNELLRSRPAVNSAIGVVFAIIAGLLLLGYLSHMVRPGAGGAVLDIPVAASDIEMGSVVGEQMISTRKVAHDYMVPGTVRKRSDISGSRALRFIGRGEPFTASSIAGSGEGTLASRIPSDLRAYPLQLRASAAGGDLRPGDRVDVISTSSDPPVTSTLLRGRLVLSVAGVQASGESGDSSRDGSTCITLLVSPPEAELLAQAECAGEISVSLCPIAPGKGATRQ